jgi:Thioesterase superfamily
MEVLVNGLRISSRRSSAINLLIPQRNRPFHSLQPFRFRVTALCPGVRPQYRFDIPQTSIPFKSSTHQLPRDPRKCFHISARNQAEDPLEGKPPNYPEAEWHRITDDFEKRLAKRSWFFRPLFRLLGHPKYQIANFSFQIVVIGGIVGLWIWIWFYMGYPKAPPPKDGTGRLLTDEEVEEMEIIENYLHSHPVVQAIRSQKHLIESRPHWAIPDRDVPHNLTGGTLRGLGRVSVAPIAFADGEGKEFYAVLHVGRDLCGPRGIVHSGLLAAVMDESLARCCFPAMPNRIGVTANLNIDYRNPLPVDSYVLVKV